MKPIVVLVDSYKCEVLHISKEREDTVVLVNGYWQALPEEYISEKVFYGDNGKLTKDSLNNICYEAIDLAEDELEYQEMMEVRGL